MNNSTIGGNNLPEGEMIYPSNPSDRINFRSLRADEIDVRPCETNNGKVRLLLYKTPRVDRNILDETVGSLNWQKGYYEERGLLFCKVGIRHPKTGEWIWKSDTGSEGNIEAEKSLASDTFKRAAFAWGIGRELYTAPRITIKLEDRDQYNGKLSQTFTVGNLQTENGVITRLTILDKWNNIRYSFPSENDTVQEAKEEPSHLSYTKSSTPAQDSENKSDNETALQSFCAKKKEVATDKEKRELERFQKYYLGPNRNAPNESIIKSWKCLDLDRLWDNWLEKSFK
jgi:hypothetical protein